MGVHIRRRLDSTNGLFLRRTVSAQLHLLALVAAIVGLFFLLHFASLRANPVHFWACLAFGLTSIAVFAVSTIYHFISDGFQISETLELKLEDADHFAIFLFIAGTYSPVILNVISPPWNWLLLAGIWLLSLLGILYTLFKGHLPLWAQHRAVYTSLFVAMGWVLLIRIHEVINHMSSFGAWMLMVGALSYTLGALVYASKRPNLFRGVFGFHELWHLAVMVGFASHYLMILDFYR